MSQYVVGVKPIVPMDTDGPSIQWPEDQNLLANIMLAQAELIHAMKRHRNAWVTMRDIREQRELKGVTYLENDTLYKIAVKDVAWWREERASAAASLSALLALRAELRSHGGR